MHSRSQPAKGFRRALLRQGDRTVIESICEFCGVRLIGNADVIAAQEPQHRHDCIKPKAKTAAKDGQSGS